MTEKPRIQRLGSYALLMEQDKLLLCRLNGGPWHEYWTLPGGGVEFGEHPEAAAVREVLEETGFDVRLGALKRITDHVNETDEARYHHVQFIYDAEIVGGELRHEVDGTTDVAEWFTKAEASKLLAVPLARLGISLAFDFETSQS